MTARRVRAAFCGGRPVSMEPNIFKYIWHHSKREQIAILLLVLGSLPFYFIALDVPKRIINRGLQGDGFDGPGSVQAFLAVDLPFGEMLTGEPIPLFDGFMMEQQDLLLALSFAFLFLVVVNGGFKFVINTRKGRLGERMLRRLRYELSDRILRFPILQVRKVKQAEIATMIKDEVEPLGGFIGDAFVAPAFLGGQALTAMAFIMVQNFWLGMVAAVVVLGQAFLIPKLRKPILRLNRLRVLAARALAGRVGEVVEGAVEVHAHDTSNFERADVSTRLGRIFEIRYEVFQRKFFVKFLNNLIAQLTPFVFYAGGGLAGPVRPPRHRRPGRGHRRLQGSARTHQGNHRLGPATQRYPDQVRTGDRAVPAEGDARPLGAGYRAGRRAAALGRDRCRQPGPFGRDR